MRWRVTLLARPPLKSSSLAPPRPYITGMLTRIPGRRRCARLPLEGREAACIPGLVRAPRDPGRPAPVATQNHLPTPRSANKLRRPCSPQLLRSRLEPRRSSHASQEASLGGSASRPSRREQRSSTRNPPRTMVRSRRTRLAGRKTRCLASRPRGSPSFPRLARASGTPPTAWVWGAARTA